MCCHYLWASRRSLAAATHQLQTAMLQWQPMRWRGTRDPCWIGFWGNHKLLSNADGLLRNLHVSGELLHLTRLRWQIGEEQTEGLVEAENVLYITCWTFALCQSLWRNILSPTFKTSPTWHCSWNNLLALNMCPTMHFYRQKVTLLDGSGTAVLKVS